jgi:L-ascorbate metabolism protein UlaG (beta-lactamase superfamily)
MRWRRYTLLASACFSVGALWALQALGWTTRTLAWDEATGWRRLSAATRERALAPRPPHRGTQSHGSLSHQDERPGTVRAGIAEQLEISWLGHSGFLLRWHGQRLLLDPNVSPSCKLARRTLEPSVEAAQIGPVDAVLISHAHFDHLDLPTLAGVPRIGTLLVPAGSERYVASIRDRITRVEGLAVGQSFVLGDLEIVATATAHNGSRFHPFASRHLAVGWIVRAPERTLYFAGDTGLGPHLEQIGAVYHPDVAILPIGAYSPGWPLRRYHLSPEDAVEAAISLGAKTVIPCHFGTFRLALDPPDTALPRFAEAAAAADLRWVVPRLWTDTDDRLAARVPSPTTWSRR